MEFIHLNKEGKKMNYDEALAWLKGERSMINIVPSHPRETWVARIAEADAATTQQAYWIVKAHKEGLLIGNEQNPEFYPLFHYT